MRVTAIACWVLLASACAHREPFTNAYASMGRRLSAPTEPSEMRVSVSLPALVASPEQHHRSKVRVEGYARFEFEGNTLCPDQGRADWKACLWLDIEGVADPGFRRARVAIEGTFDGENLGHLGIAGGAIGQITVITRIK